MMEAIEKYSDFLEDSFKDGVVLRELRLSDNEAEELKMEYSGASLNKLPEDICIDGKVWYEVKLLAK